MKGASVKVAIWAFLWFIPHFSFFEDLRILKSSGFKDPQILRTSISSNVMKVTFEDFEILRLWGSLNLEDLRILSSPKNKNTHPQKINHIVTKSEKIMIKIQLESEKEFFINNNEDGHMLGYLQNKKSESIWSFKNQLQ